MTGDDIPRKPEAPVVEPPPEAPRPEPRSGSGADTALEAMIRKRQMRAGSEPTLPGDGTRKPAKR